MTRRSFGSTVLFARWRRLVAVPLALAVVTGAAAAVALVLGATPASALNQCSNGACVTNVNFQEPGSYSLPNSFCGIEGDYAPLGAADIDAADDDPYGLGTNNEGNYPDSEAFSFAPATALVAGQTLTVTLPHPSQTPGQGAVFPNAQLSAFDFLESGSTVRISSVIPATTGMGAHPEEVVIDVNTDGISGQKVALGVYDPYQTNPLTPSGGNHGTNVSFLTASTLTTNGSGDASFELSDNSQEEVTFTATDTTIGFSAAQTATFDFNGGPSAGQLGEACAGAVNAPAQNNSSEGFPYLLSDGHGHTYFGSVVAVTETSGLATATVVVPNGFSDTDQSGVTLDVLDTISPPGIGTPLNAAMSADDYPNSDFSISTSADPVPAYGGQAPTFVADYGEHFDFGCFCVDGPLPFFPVDPYTSTLTTSASTAQVAASGGPTATATLNDVYVNPVNDKQVSIFADLPTHAAVTPQATPTNNDAYPSTGDNGQTSYSVTDNCAETVTLQAVDVDDNIAVEGSGSPSITFTAGPPVAPDGSSSPVCANNTSRVTASTGGGPATSGSPVTVPADGATTATVKVTLADQFGNIDACQLVALTPNTQNAVVTPQPPASGDACPAPHDGPGYSGEDGVATFTVTDSHVENVTLGVIDESSSALWPSNATTNPFDVAQLNFVGADPSQSSVTPPSQNAPATGTAQITVSLKTAAGSPLAKAGQTIELTGCSAACTGTNADPTTTITPHSGYESAGTDEVFTDANGQAVFDVADSSTSLPHTVFYQATDVSGGFAITQQAQVTFTEGGATLAAVPSPVVADGIGTSTLTFTLTDTNQADVPGASVTLSSPSSTVGITPNGAQTTDASGQTQFTVSDTAAENATFTATATFSSSPADCPSAYSAGTCTVKASAAVQFISPPTSLSVSASPGSVPADGVSTSQVTVTALNGKNAITGLPVQLVATPAGNSAVIGPSSGVTGSNGTFTFQVSDKNAEPVTLAAQYADSVSSAFLNCQGACTSTTTTVVFTLTEGEASTITATTAHAPADGASTVCVTVTAQTSKAIVGDAIALYTGSATTNVTPYRGPGCTNTNVGATTNSSGQVFFTITDTVPETLSVYARDLYTGVLIGNQPPASPPLLVSFTATEAEASTVTASPSTVPAGGPTSTVTVTLMNSTGTAPYVGDTVSLAASSSTVKISPATAHANASGQATFTVSDGAVESVTIKATDVTKAVTLEQSAVVTFTASEANQSTVTISPISTPANGPAATLTVVVRDATGLARQGETVVIKGATPTTTVTPLLTGGVTNVNGVAQFSVSDTAIETETLSACDTTLSAACTQDPGGLLDQTATISFTASEANESTISAAASSVPAFAVGCPNSATTWVCPTTTVTVTLRNAGGAALSGHVVSLSGSSSTASVSPATVTTNAAGQAAFAVGDSVVQSVVFTALDKTTGAVVVPTVTVSFTANEANQSTVTGTPGLGAVTWTVTVTLKNPSSPTSPFTDSPLVGHKVTLTTGSKTTKVLTLTKGGVTTATGQIQFTITDTVTQVLSVYATDTTSSVRLYGPLSVSIYR